MGNAVTINKLIMTFLFPSSLPLPQRPAAGTLSGLGSMSQQ